MIDYNKHSYVKIDSFTNVVNEIPMTKQQGDGKSIIHGRLWQVIYDLSLRHPEWQFVGEDSWWNHTMEAFDVKRFRIYEDNDEIGTIRIETWNNEKFEIRNSRISNAMAKRSHKTTTDPKKAAKIVEQFFKSKTLAERVNEAKSAASSAVSNRAWGVTREFNTVMEKLAPALAAYVTLNMHTLRPTLEAFGAPSAALDTLTEKNEERKLANYIQNVRNNSQGITVLLHGDKYVMMDDRAGEEPQVLAASQLSDDLRGKMGILKVVENNDIIESVGMRISPTTFYVVR